MTLDARLRSIGRALDKKSDYPAMYLVEEDEEGRWWRWDAMGRCDRLVTDQERQQLEGEDIFVVIRDKGQGL